MRISDWSSDVCSSDLHEIEAAAGRTISEIFEKFGEAHFRDGERRVIARLIDGEPKVIATGGGAFMNEETRTLILDKSIAVWLDADIDTLVERVGRRDHRPLLKNRDPRRVLSALAAVRTDRKSTRLNSRHYCSPRMSHSA